ncbi:MAG: M28 family peptidase, partial [Phycisphaerae bacterium]
AGAARVGLKAVFDHPEWTYQSDHYVFFSEKIPFLYFGVEDHPDYHRPTDTPEKTNQDQMERVSRLMLVVVQNLADAPRRPAWREGGVEAADKPRE